MRKSSVVPRYDYMVFAARGDHEVEEIAVHRVRNKQDALDVAAAIITAEYDHSEQWCVFAAMRYTQRG